MKRINNKIVWITGASSGIGEALTYSLNTKNCKLIISARREDELNKVKQQCAIPENVKIVPIDLGDHDKMALNVEKAVSLFGKIDVLINNAGISQRSLIKDTNFDVYKKLIDVNYLGTIALTKALLPYFIKQKSGNFTTITSLMGKFGSPYRSGYCGAKHALHGFFDVLRMEHEKDAISVTLICPGFIQTDVAKNALTANGSKQETEDEATKNGIPPSVLSKKIIHAIEKEKFEVYIGKKEIIAIYIKRFFPKLLHKIIFKSEVR
ncbi:short-subunit dehydrogenase [Maribacter vaceletii]|uniref:Short-subunit dehydrogenase n=1 Tax=Maribacter vaceletii TaxID=1206816 RepID=A0A495EAN4_9FLAO|nr:SDR family oxidoreductase [Maribacter vaceletii]RKR12927.1 short-subunit dehydrogenase [Maribacter vaceletii]